MAFTRWKPGSISWSAGQAARSGVKSVQVLSGQAVWDAHSAGRWPQEIAEAALGAVKQPNGKPQDYTNDVHAFDITYRDGQRMTVLMANGYSQEFAFAYRVKGRPEIVAASYRPGRRAPPEALFRHRSRAGRDVPVRQAHSAPANERISQPAFSPMAWKATYQGRRETGHARPEHRVQTHARTRPLERGHALNISTGA